jgi:hypothetical protein
VSPVARDFLLEWLGKLLILGAVVCAFVAVYFIGKERGRQAQRRLNVLSAIEEASAVTVAIPMQRSETDR